jgi:hypothetical protein
MNLDLYTEEFRNFKYLKSDARAVNYFRKNTETINKIQPWAQINDPNFVWETRLEFLEQLFDLRQETVYFVIPAELYNSNREYNYEDSRIYEIKKPFIYRGKAIQMDQKCTTEDIPQMEENPAGFYLTSEEGSLLDRIFLTMETCPLIPGDFPSYAAMFYSKDVALSYKDAITFFLRKNIDAITTISRAF